MVFIGIYWPRWVLNPGSIIQKSGALPLSHCDWRIISILVYIFDTSWLVTWKNRHAIGCRFEPTCIQYYDDQPGLQSAPPTPNLANHANPQTANCIFWPIYICTGGADWSVLFMVVIGDHCSACGLTFLRMHQKTYNYYVFTHRILY